MANRAYLYSLSNRPASFRDRPETIRGLSEWAYAVPFCFRVLMSGDTRLCASFVSDGFDDEPADRKTLIHAVSGDFELGFERLKRFFAVVERRARAQGASALASQVQESIAFLEAHRERYLLLETVELDMMSAEGGPALRARVEAEVAECARVGAAIDALPSDLVEAGARLQAGCEEKGHAFYGLRLDDRFDDTRDGSTEYPLGLSGWSEVLYFELCNRAEFEERRAELVAAPGAPDLAAKKLRRARVVTVLLLAALGVMLLRSWLATR